jgi:hypothetical protein
MQFKKAGDGLLFLSSWENRDPSARGPTGLGKHGGETDDETRVLAGFSRRHRDAGTTAKVLIFRIE